MMNQGFLVPTGRIIKEYLEEYGIAQKDLSMRIGMSEKHISNLLSGNSRLTEEVAIKLETIIHNVPASYWLNLESKYRERLAREAAEQKINEKELVKIAKRFHFNEVFGGLEWSLQKQAKEMLKLLKISDFVNFKNAYSYLAVNFMEDGGEEEAIAIWLQLCEEDVEVQNDDLVDIKYNKGNLEKNIQIFKQLAQSEQIETITQDCRKLCNMLGVYLVVYPAITNCKVRGAVTTVNNHPAIFLSGRFKTHDHIWFAFLHELGHLLYHYNKKETIVSFDEEVGNKEEEANQFARDFLINHEAYRKFVVSQKFKERDIRNFAVEQRVHPGIVVARLQHDKHLKMSEMNQLKVKINIE